MEAIPRTLFSHDWITLLLLLAFILLAVVKSNYPYRFSDFTLLFATNKYLLLQGKEPKFSDSFNVLLFIVNVLSVSLFIFLFYDAISSTGFIKPKIIFIRILTAYTTFVLLKFFIEKIIANILSLDEKFDFYLFYKLSYRNFLAMMILPLNMILIFLWQPGLMAWYTVIGLILLANLMINALIIKKNQHFLLSHGFYFILYLCALEIGPYYILYKLITL